MQTRQQYIDAYHEAMKIEQELWERVVGHGPGQPGHDRALWERWLEAVGRTTRASKALREAFSDPSPST